jgi:hypothetical protein
MKIAKLSVICLACCFFAGRVLAQPDNVGIGISVRAEFQGTNTLAFVAEDGDIIEYIVTINLTASQFPITDGEPSLTLPNGTVIDLGDNLALATGGSIVYPPQAYTVNVADLGNQTGAAANEVRALARVEAISQTGQTTQDVTATTNFDTVVVNPCVDVEKVASCDIAKEGDIYNYTITISNCGGDELTVVSIDDTMFGSLLPDCSILAPGADCVIEIPYTVLPGDPDLIENTVTVVYAITGIPSIQVTDTDDAEVEVVHPDFTVTKTCLTDGVIADEVTFEIVITNTGDIPLNFVTDEASIAPFSLDAGAPPSVHQVVVPVAPGATEVENTVNVVATIPAEYVCGDNDDTIEKQASDTCTVLEADFTVTKECTTPEVQVGDDATFHITITNTGDVPLSFTTNEPELWVQEPIVLSPGGVFEADVNRTTMSGMDIISNTIEVTGVFEDITIVKQDSADCAVTINLTNLDPVAYDNSYGFAHNVELTVNDTDGTITGTLNGALADYDPDNLNPDRLFDNTLTVMPLAGITTANGGTVTLNADGSFTYTPSQSNTSGTDSFDYTLLDGHGGTDTATVTINLTNADPVAYDNSYSSPHNVQLTVNAYDGTIIGTLNGALADYDPDNSNANKVFDDTLTVTPLNGITTANGGTVTLNADGSFTYTPSQFNTSGTDSFDYTLLDGFGGTDTATVTINLANVQTPKTLYVDDNAAGDPAPGDPSISDPSEDGSEKHPFDAIQKAIDAASDGDTVIVMPGIYTGMGNRDIRFFGKSITVRGTDPSNQAVVDQTIINCQGNASEPHRGFIFDSGETNASVLEGVTITGGYAETGAGIYISSTSHPTIRRCLIFNNTAVKGGGIGGGQ